MRAGKLRGGRTHTSESVPSFAHHLPSFAQGLQKIAKAAGISARTIYIKYENKEDLLVKLFIDEVLVPYETAVLKDFDPQINFAEGVRRLWLNMFEYLRANSTSFALLQHGKSSPLLNKAYQERNIKQGVFFKVEQIFLIKKSIMLLSILHKLLQSYIFSLRKFTIDIKRGKCIFHTIQ